MDGKVEFSGKLAKVQKPDAKTLLYCETYGEENRFYVPQVLKKKLLESMHEFLRQEIRATR